MKRQLLQVLLLTGSVWVLVTNPAQGEKVQRSSLSNSTNRNNNQQLLLLSSEQTVEPTRDRRHSQVEETINSADTLVQSPTPSSPSASQVVEVISVKANATDNGVEVILETPRREQLQVLNRNQGNSLIADIPDAQLRLPNGDGFIFRSEKPIAGITEITVTNFDANTIRVIVTGEAGVPTVELFDSDEGLIFGLTPVASSTETQEELPQKPDTPDPVQPGSETQPDETSAEEEEIEIVVTGEQETGYSVPDASTATRIEVPIRDIPQSIQVIPRQVIEDRQVVRLNELADNVSGVQPQSGYGGLSSQGYYIRGFPLEFETFRNGFRDFGFTSPRDVANVERVEILKGPASVLYGSANGFGGLVSTVTKKPLSEPLFNPSVTVGNYGFYRSTLDIGGPLTNNGSLLYRFNAAYENADSYRDFNENESIFVAPALTWQISPRTTLTAEFEYQNYDYVFDRGLLPSQLFLDLPRGRFLGEPDLNNAEFESFSGTYNFEHQFSDNWKFRQGFNALRVTGNTISASADAFDPPFVEADGRTLARRVRKTDEEQENYTLQNEITGEFNTGSIRHNVLFGVELARYRFAYDFERADIAPIDIFDPQYGAERGDFAPDFAEEYGADNVAIYVQDLIQVLPNLKVLAGVRFDSNDIFYRDTLSDAFDFEQSESDFSPRLGIVYQPSESTSVYASWSNSFNPQFFSRNQAGEAFEPEKGKQFEIGVKQEFLDGRLSATLALYNLTRKNVLTTDPDDPDFSIQTGEQTSRGVELDVTGEISPGWNIIATYAYTNAFVSEDEDIPVGQRLVNRSLAKGYLARLSS